MFDSLFPIGHSARSSCNEKGRNAEGVYQREKRERERERERRRRGEERERGEEKRRERGERRRGERGRYENVVEFCFCSFVNDLCSEFDSDGTYNKLNEGAISVDCVLHFNLTDGSVISSRAKDM